MSSTENTVVADLSLVTRQGKKSFGGASDQYDLEEVLGEGSYGSVYKCRRESDGARFAAKIIDTMRIGFVGGADGIRTAQIMAAREVHALRQLSAHPGIISLEAAFFSEATRQIFIVTEFVAGSHLFSHVVQRTEPLQEPEASYIMNQLADAVSFCHALGVVHRDLKLENVLVASVNVRLAEQTCPASGARSWQTEELFTVKICDFGFAKSLRQFTTRTPVGTGTYAAPEVNVDTGKERQRRLSPADAASGEPRYADGARAAGQQYNAFKADAFSLGVMTFVMLCLGFPARDRDRKSYRMHKLWATLSADAQSLIDGLLEVDPATRFSVIDVCNHAWLRLGSAVEEGEDAGVLRRMKSKEITWTHAEAEFATRRSPQPRWRSEPGAQDPLLPGVLALHRALVHIQQERAMACWALAGVSGLSGISCWDQLQWHVQLTEKRIHEAKALLTPTPHRSQSTSVAEEVEAVFVLLTKARQLSLASSARPADAKHLETFDSVFSSYNEACGALTEIVARTLLAVRPSSSEGRRAARRYRLCCAAAEQLGRERAFMCGRLGGPAASCGTRPRLAAAAASGAQAVSEDRPSGAAGDAAAGVASVSTTERDCHGRGGTDQLLRLAEILGARKILLGTATVVPGSMSGDLVASSFGLLGALIGEDEPPLLSTDDIAQLEALEQRVLNPKPDDTVPTEEWYQVLSRFVHEIHSRIAVNLVEDMRLQLPRLSLADTSPATAMTTPVGTAAPLASSRTSSCGCRAGLKRLLKDLAEKL